MDWYCLIPLLFLLVFGFNREQRHHIFKRDKARCVQCGRRWSDNYMLECDHIVTLSDGGRSEVTNGQLLCRECHANKHANLAQSYKRKGNIKKHNQNASASRLIRKRGLWRR